MPRWRILASADATFSLNLLQSSRPNEFRRSGRLLAQARINSPRSLTHKIPPTRTKRKEKALKRLLFSAFYRILDKISVYKMPLDAGTFSLIDKKVVRILTNLEEKNMYFSGLRSWVGFSQKGIIYERDKRFTGKPTSFRKLLKLAMDGFFSFSYIPLRIASFLGFIFALFAFLMIIFVIGMRIFFNWGIVGWASTLSMILLIGGVQLITLGIIGEYLARIYDQVKGRPEYIISDRGGLK